MEWITLCIQVLSESVSQALYLTGGSEAFETAYFIQKMDKFFDCLNVRFYNQGKLSRKPFSRSGRLDLLTPTVTTSSVLSYTPRSNPQRRNHGGGALQRNGVSPVTPNGTSSVIPNGATPNGATSVTPNGAISVTPQGTCEYYQHSLGTARCFCML